VPPAIEVGAAVAPSPPSDDAAQVGPSAHATPEGGASQDDDGQRARAEAEVAIDVPDQQAATEENKVQASSAVEAAAAVEPGAVSEARAALAVAAPRRFVVAAAVELGISGEFRLMEGAEVNGKPAFKAASCANEEQWPHLLWTPQAGGHWAFIAAASASEPPALEAQTSPPIARSLQLAYTAWPDELMFTSWTAAPWGKRGRTTKVAVIRI